jgi:hypothetical protein
MRTHNKIFMTLALAVVGLIVAACGKGSDNNNANPIGTFGVGMVGPYLTSAVGNDGGTGSVVSGGYGNTTVQLELSFYGQGFGATSAQGYLRILANPYGCPQLQAAYFQGVTAIFVSSVTPGTLAGSNFGTLQMQSTSGVPLSFYLTGGLPPRVEQGIGPNGAGTNIYPNLLQANMNFSGCPTIALD